ncbi:phosphoserine phosphatase [Mollisia scopiformis]|uniref:Phosphoserine phosphatase n=1 Tax=Mollisia scopiformis TaxID=149040 RepID=A0A194XTP8_MOLSC|nr:phosphoserine phosphatase [Mollisia scopiformis]KUJ23516.1 phosphoserine phosphatase [Mollisia scopiformis]
MPFPDYIEKKPKIIFFTDFDGTISNQDSCDWLIEHEGYGYAKMQEGFQAVYDGKRTYGEVSCEQFESIKTPFDQCIEKILTHVELDEHFITFYEWCISASIPLVILSGGLTPIIRALLGRAIGHELRGVEIIANSVVVRNGFESLNDQGGAWRVQFHDENIYGHDKACAIQPYTKHREGLPKHEKSILLYAGDGVSDLSAAKETDLLFAKQGEDKYLVKYCKQQKIPFTEFKNWKEILEITQDLYHDSKSVRQVIEQNRGVLEGNDSHI